MSPSGHPSMKVGLCPQPDPVEPSPVPGVCGWLGLWQPHPQRQCRKQVWSSVWFLKSAGQRARAAFMVLTPLTAVLHIPARERDGNKPMSEAGCLQFLFVCIFNWMTDGGTGHQA